MITHDDRPTTATGGTPSLMARMTGRLQWAQHPTRLRTVLFIAFTLIATIPVGLLAAWQQQSAFEKELAEVSERHLLIAQNLSHAIDRYSEDVEAVFRMAVSEMQTRNAEAAAVAALLAEMGFRHACIIDSAGRIVASLDGTAQGEEINRKVGDMTPLRRIAKAAGIDPAFSGVRLDREARPTLHIVQQLSEGRLAIGTLGTSYIVDVQQRIAFGQRGHSAIVDQYGRVIAHPNKTWQQQAKDISRVSAVARMMKGETGVTTFYSPAMDAEMIAGFTSAPHTGWGVMVPQPLAELSAHARSVQLVSILIGGLGLLVAIIIAWVIARYLARPIEQVADVARAVSAGDTSARVSDLPPRTPREIVALAEATNQMLTDLSSASRRLRTEAARAEAANQAKGRFLANMSHEFRTPLNAILGFAEIMRDPKIHTDDAALSREFSTDILRAGQHMLNMVDNILELTRAEGGHLQLDLAPVDVREAVGFAVSLVRQDAVARNITLTTEAVPDLPVINSDVSKIQQIAVNILSNAVKFTDPGGNIQVRLATDPHWPVVIQVIDDGIGISEGDMALVMTPFGQVADALTRNHDGTGLGLALTQELVDLLQGQIEMQSALGEGTTVTIRLPDITARETGS
ncbi:MAG: sensor histidine kinase [Minwuia sp.]|nr:sensor histidine kinase [Minwuia sp.]